jgi:uncharacterized protein (TIGR03067 family)
VTTELPVKPKPTSQFRWWRDWLLSSLVAVFLLSLVAAHLPPRLMPIIIFPIGFAIACGIAIRQCAEFAGTAPAPSRRWLQRVLVCCLLLGGFAHLYWIVCDRYLNEARESIAEQADERRQKEQIAAAIALQGHDLDEAGMAALLQPPAEPPTFLDYLSRRLHSDLLPRFVASQPWPAIIFGLEILTATSLGVWIAVEAATKRLNGRWLVQAMELRGSNVPLEAETPKAIEAWNGRLTVYSDQGPNENLSNIRFRLSDAVTPWNLDLVRTRQGRTESLHCLARLTGDTLQVALPVVPVEQLPADAPPRPASFDTTAGDLIVVALKRAT